MTILKCSNHGYALGHSILVYKGYMDYLSLANDCGDGCLKVWFNLSLPCPMCSTYLVVMSTFLVSTNTVQFSFLVALGQVVALHLADKSPHESHDRLLVIIHSKSESTKVDCDRLSVILLSGSGHSYPSRPSPCSNGLISHIDIGNVDKGRILVVGALALIQILCIRKWSSSSGLIILRLTKQVQMHKS